MLIKCTHTHTHTKLPLLTLACIGIKLLSWKTNERKNDNATINQLFIAPNEVLFHTRKKIYYCGLTNKILNVCRVGISALMLLLQTGGTEGLLLVDMKSTHVCKVEFPEYTKQPVISQGYSWLEQSVPWTLALLYNCIQKSSGSLNYAVLLWQIICEASLPSGVHTVNQLWSITWNSCQLSLGEWYS